MKTGNITSRKVLAIIGLLCAAGAMVLAIISSRKAYPMTDIRTTALLSGGTAILLLLVAILEGKKGIGVLLDLFCAGSIVLLLLAFSRLIVGRLNLMGYVWFSDLEKGNPAAVGALNLSLAAWILYLAAVIAIIILGFKKREFAA